MPTYSPATYILLLIAIRQTLWTTSILDTLILTSIANNIRQTLLQQISTIIRSNTEDPKLSIDTCGVTSMAFSRLRPTDSYISFRASVIHTSLKLITASEYLFQHERVTTVSGLSPSLQSTLQIRNEIQPVTQWRADRPPQHRHLHPDGRGVQPLPSAVHALLPLPNHP